MHFEQGHIYHVYNQGNNRQRIFFERENYLFFLKKMREFLLPHGNIISYCLMPNHFHLMIEVEKYEVTTTTHGVTLSHPVSNKTRDINSSIGIMLRSYTRAINKQSNRSGGLFREATKAECLTECKGITPSFFQTLHGAKINTATSDESYVSHCFNYIHSNPVRSGLVRSPEEWEFSSYQDYCGKRKGTLVNIERAKELINNELLTG